MLSKIFKSSINKRLSFLNSIATKNKFSFSNKTIQHSPYLYPYFFGGIKNLDLPKQSENQQFLQDIFGEDINSGFAYAYKQIIQALYYQDKQYLNDFLEKKLTNNLKFLDTSLLNQNAKIKTVTGRIYLCFGLAFDRQFHPKEVLKREYQHSFSTLHSQKIKDQQGRYIISLLIEVYFTSSMKLVKHVDSIESQQLVKQEKEKNNQETHIVQFEIENRFSGEQLISFLISSFFRNIFNPKNLGTDFTKKFLGTNSEKFMWRVSDIDKVLKENLPIIRGN